MSLANHREAAGFKHFWREWIWADFRDFHFTWPGFVRWTAIVMAAFLIACVITLYFLDWNQFRGSIGAYASRRYGRPVRIEGDLKVDLFRGEPHVSIGDLFIGDPAWVGRPQAARIHQTEIIFRLWPALFGHIVLPLVRFDRPDFFLLRKDDGRTNWDSGSTSKQGWRIPPIQRFLVRDGHVEIEDAVRRLKFLGTISSEETAGGQGAAFQLNGSGTLNANKFLADVHGGPLINVDETRPYHFSADLHAGPTHAVIEGDIRHPFHLGQFDARVTASGQSLSELYYLTGVTLPGTAPYSLSGRLKRDGPVYSVSELAGLNATARYIRSANWPARSVAPTCTAP